MATPAKAAAPPTGAPTKPSGPCAGADAANPIPTVAKAVPPTIDAPPEINGFPFSYALDAKVPTLCRNSGEIKIPIAIPSPAAAPSKAGVLPNGSDCKAGLFPTYR